MKRKENSSECENKEIIKKKIKKLKTSNENLDNGVEKKVKLVKKIKKEGPNNKSNKKLLKANKLDNKNNKKLQGTNFSDKKLQETNLNNKKLQKPNLNKNKKLLKADPDNKNIKKLQVKKKFEKINKSKNKILVKGKNAKNTDEKPNWSEIKAEKKKLKLFRKSKKLNDMFDIVIEVKNISETFRRKDCDPEKRKELVSKCHKLMENSYKRFVLSHDLSRVVQWLIKHSNDEIRQAIMTEVKPLLVTMFESKYARHCIKMFLKFGTKEIKETIVNSCIGHVVKLLSHSIASPIIDMVYKDHASEQAKIYYRQELYGGLYKNSKDDSVKSLKDVIEKSPDMKSATLSAMKLNLTKILNKDLVSSAIVQSVLSEYMSECSPDDRYEFIVTLRDSIDILSSTKDGAKIAMMCIWHGTAKDRKMCLKSMKENVLNLSLSEHGYLILLAMFDSIDDTVLVKKILFPELQQHLTELIHSEYGRKVILYLVARRDTHFFNQTIIDDLQKGDGNSSSKKPADIRAKELCEGIIDSLLESIKNETANWLASNPIAWMTYAILKASYDGDKLHKAFEAIADFLINPKSTIRDGKNKYKAIEHGGVHIVLKKLITGDKILIEKNRKTFGEILISKLDESIIQSWIEVNRGCFLLVFLLENQKEENVNILLSKIKAVKKILKEKEFSGAKILLEKLKALKEK